MVGESGATIRPLVAGQPLLIIKSGAPLIHIWGAHLVGALKVDGGQLELIDCSIEADHSTDGQPGGSGRRLNPSAQATPLLIDSGQVTLKRVLLSGHTSGAISVRAATLALVESTIQGNQAEYGGAIRATEGSFVRLERSNMTGNVADMSGGALQVRHCSLTC